MSFVTLRKEHSLWDILTKDPDEDWNKIVYRWPMVTSPTPVLISCLTYIVLVKFVGPVYMKEREPFRVKSLIIAYNFTMIGVNLWLFKEYGRLGWFANYSWTCQLFDPTATGMPMIELCFVYYMTKFLDWMDTCFFVLTKKFSHISWLHLIHHSTMPLYCFVGMRIGANGHYTLPCMINSLVHVIMYSYYGLSCCGDRIKPFLWWKKYITQIQLLQFFLVFLHMCHAFFRSDCNYSPHLFYVISFQMGSFTLLFTNFYIQKYIRKSKKQENDRLIVEENKNDIGNLDPKTHVDINNNILQRRTTKN